MASRTPWPIRSILTVRLPPQAVVAWASLRSPGGNGFSVLLARFGATDGDQTTGGQVSFGPEGGSDRALGLLATSSTGVTAFGARLINGTGITLTRMNVQFTGEIWRQSNVPKMPPILLPGGSLRHQHLQHQCHGVCTGTERDFSHRDRRFRWSGGGRYCNPKPDQSQRAKPDHHQLATRSRLVAGLANDRCVRQGPRPSHRQSEFLRQRHHLGLVSIQSSGANLLVIWTGTAGQTYQLEYADDLASPSWTPVGSPVTGTGGTLSTTNSWQFIARLLPAAARQLNRAIVSRPRATRGRPPTSNEAAGEITPKPLPLCFAIAICS